MIFNSMTFVVFLAAVFPLYWLARGRWKNLVLFVASYVFYGWWDWRFLGLLAISTLIDFGVGQAIDRTEVQQRRKRLLLVSVFANLGILGFFKYFNFFVDGFADMVESVGLDPNRTSLNILLPVGISFYTFQTMSYTFDVYRRRLPASTDLLAFACYVAYFPQLVAGPIERAARLLPIMQDTNRSFPRRDQIRSGLLLIGLGLFRKVVIADGVAGAVNEVFARPEDHSALAIAVGVVAFSLQIYGDFAGYTDIARGVSRLFGIELMVNFTQPYLSRNITEFWRRWHISLSDWLRDYLYVSLGGNRGGTLATYRNLMLTMLLGGLWHGASWTFVLWGGFNGLLLGLHRAFRGGRVSEHDVRWGDTPSILLHFAVFNFGVVLFRADSLDTTLTIWGRMVTLAGGYTDVGDLCLVAVIAVVALTLDVLQRRATVPTLLTERPLLAGAALTSAALVTLVFSAGAPTPFIYFQF